MNDALEKLAIRDSKKAELVKLSSEFVKDFAPDEKFNYRRDANPAPKRLGLKYSERS